MSASGLRSVSDSALQPRLYFDGPRSRFFTEFFCYDFSWLESFWVAQSWCSRNGFEFIDNRIDRLPVRIRPSVLLARRAGALATPSRSIRQFLSDLRPSFCVPVARDWLFDMALGDF